MSDSLNLTDLDELRALIAGETSGQLKEDALYLCDEIAATIAIFSAPIPSPWIPCSERMPEEFQRVTVWDEREGEPCTAQFQSLPLAGTTTGKRPLLWISDPGSERSVHATHWMPLPEGPT